MSHKRFIFSLKGEPAKQCEPTSFIPSVNEFIWAEVTNFVTGEILSNVILYLDGPHNELITLPLGDMNYDDFFDVELRGLRQLVVGYHIYFERNGVSYTTDHHPGARLGMWFSISLKSHDGTVVPDLVGGWY